MSSSLTFKRWSGTIRCHFNAVVTRGTTMQEPSFSEGGRAYIQPRREEGPETGVRLSPEEFITRIDPVYGDCFSKCNFLKKVVFISFTETSHIISENLIVLPDTRLEYFSENGEDF